MRKEKILINHTNHPSDKWSEFQKEGWNKIIDLPFPNISPEIDEKELSKLVKEKFMEIREIIKSYKNENIEVWICLQGEFSYCYMLFDLLMELGNSNFKGIAIPTTERKTIEKDNIKTSVFEFIRWRFLKRKE